VSKHVLFLVHGMGVHDEGWAETVKETLVRLSNRYSAFEAEPLVDRVSFKEIRYDQSFEETLARWRAAGSGPANFARGKDLAFVGDLDWLDDLSTKKDDFFWTHITDVLIYRLFALERTAVRASVATQFARGVDALLDEDPEGRASVLSHSLGTAVSHDAIHALGSQEFDVPDLANAFGPTHWRFQNLFTLANVSRFMATDIDPYTSMVRPGAVGSADTYCEDFYNFRHDLDPFPLPKKFGPSNWGTRFSSESIDTLHHWNPHGLLHYLNDPRVHVPILRALTGFSSVASAEFDTALEEHKDAKGLLKEVEDRLGAAEVERVREILDKLKALKAGLSDAPSFAEAMKMVDEASKLLSELRDLTEDLIEGFEF